MLGSTIVYSGLTLVLVGLICLVKPMRWLKIPTRARAVTVAALGLLMAGVMFALPVSESRIDRVATRLDEFAPVWQFSEFHTIRIAAPPPRVYEAIKRVRADEIFLFRTLTWIRRGGRPLPASILDAAGRESLLDLATRTSFVWLADEPPREMVVGTVIVAPPGTRGKLTPQVFQKPLPPGFVLATMNFVVTPDANSGSIVSTETRVFANSPSTRRGFAVYWRLIYPGSAIIRRMWLRAVERRATGPDGR
jgi:hypothetical protein